MRGLGYGLERRPDQALRHLADHHTHMNYSLNSLKGGYIGDYIRDYYRGY